MGYESEAQLERNLINDLIEQGFRSVKISNEEELKNNFRNELFEHNKEKLNSIPFTDTEFNRILTFVESKSVFDSAQILRDKFVIERDDGNNVYIELFDIKDWCKNRYQVTSQTTIIGKRENRYDVTILINGLPLVQIELKRRGVELSEAFNQVNRYRKDSLFRSLYRYIQIFIISNGVDTKYFANSDGKILFSHTFFWSDNKNKRISNLKEFTKTFLDKCFVSKIIARYMVVNKTDDLLMVMRPYQIYAVEAIVERAFETNNNGYVWHTTGSGKTLTSFKVSQILSREPNIKKVFFLVDRRDLDSQTISEFNKFDKDCVDTTDKTETLVKQIKNINTNLIVTTIQKMAKAINNEKYLDEMQIYKNDKVVFIIDECHRTQFGDMHKVINKHFINAQYFGFTGTPRFEKNKSQDGRITNDLFEKCLHTYLIKDAIYDQNVLGFSVEYRKTFDCEYDETDTEEVKAINKEEIYMHDDRIRNVAQDIIKIHNGKTCDKTYNAIFAVSSIDMLIKYYKAFKEIDHDLKIAGIYTFAANEDFTDKEEHSRDSLDKIIKDYNQMFGGTHSTEEFSSYFADVSKRVKAEGKYKTEKIDILLVVNMFLTGFDSKTLNTLYVDKKLEYHNLLQAYSRTNRILSDKKPYGNIVCYRNLKKNTDEALVLFSKKDNIEGVLMKSYDEYLEQWFRSLKNLKDLAKTPADVDLLKGEEEQKKFVICFRELTKILEKLKSFVEFEFSEDKLELSEQTYQDFKSKYFGIYENVIRDKTEKTSILEDVDFKIELMHTDKINVDYIMKLIKDIDLKDKKRQTKDIKKIIKELENTDNEQLKLKVDLIKAFLNEEIPKLSDDADIEKAYKDFEEIEKDRQVEEFSKNLGLEKDVIKGFISNYIYSGSQILDKPAISDYVKEKLKIGLIKTNKIKAKIIDFIEIYDKKFK